MSPAAGIRMDVAKGEGGRRLPIYLLLDCSQSMNGTPIEAVRRGLEHFTEEVKKDTFASETVRIGVILFDGDGARTVTPGLIDIADFVPPTLEAKGRTPLGGALRELTRSLDNDVLPTIVGRPKGDWKPLAFILTDGAPTDDWQSPRKEILDRTGSRMLNVITVGCGPYIDRDTLRSIAIGPTFVLDEANDKYFQPFFTWVTQSVIQVSQDLSRPGDDSERKTQLAPAPPQVVQLTF